VFATHNTDDAFHVEWGAASYRLAVAAQNFAMVVHLPESPLGVLAMCGHNADVIDPLPGARSYVETVAIHFSVSPVVSPGSLRRYAFSRRLTTFRRDGNDNPNLRNYHTHAARMVCLKPFLPGH
jgi:hypothetical protein